MSLFVNTNVSSLNAQRQLQNSGNALGTAFQRLSSGFRINSAADDAAGLQINNRLTSQIQGLDQAVRNANDGISVAQVAEGAMDEISTALQRMRVLAVQAENGINSEDDKGAIQAEIDQLVEEIDRIANTTSFGGEKLLDGELGDVSFLVGANSTADDRITIDLGTARDSEALTVDAVDVTGSTSAAAIESIDAAIKTIGSARAGLGAIQNRLQSTIRNLSNISENVSEARSRIRDTDFAKETAELTRAQILQQTSVTVLAQANQRPQTALSLLG
jgi:flagellin